MKNNKHARYYLWEGYLIVVSNKNIIYEYIISEQLYKAAISQYGIFLRCYIQNKDNLSAIY